ncbi:MAG: nucleotidyltransferase domain-containing protein [Anaerolineae bacterium]|nr:nucleotidyltransferase domain-containing protein [Anaerolineae bacterium]
MNLESLGTYVLDSDIQRAIQILKAAGCSEVFLFGSAITGQMRPDSDLDLAVRGCPRGEFFHLLGQLLLELDRPVDLINLDAMDAFADCLRKEGTLVRIG